MRAPNDRNTSHLEHRRVNREPSARDGGVFLSRARAPVTRREERRHGFQLRDLREQRRLFRDVRERESRVPDDAVARVVRAHRAHEHASRARAHRDASLRGRARRENREDPHRGLQRAARLRVEILHAAAVEYRSRERGDRGGAARAVVREHRDGARRLSRESRQRRRRPRRDRRRRRHAEEGEDVRRSLRFSRGRARGGLDEDVDERRERARHGRGVVDFADGRRRRRRRLDRGDVPLLRRQRGAAEPGDAAAGRGRGRGRFARLRRRVRRGKQRHERLDRARVVRELPANVRVAAQVTQQRRGSLRQRGDAARQHRSDDPRDRRIRDLAARPQRHLRLRLQRAVPEQRQRVRGDDAIRVRRCLTLSDVVRRVRRQPKHLHARVDRSVRGHVRGQRVRDSSSRRVLRGARVQEERGRARRFPRGTAAGDLGIFHHAHLSLSRVPTRGQKPDDDVQTVHVHQRVDVARFAHRDDRDLAQELRDADAFARARVDSARLGALQQLFELRVVDRGGGRRRAGVAFLNLRADGFKQRLERPQGVKIRPVDFAGFSLARSSHPALDLRFFPRLVVHHLRGEKLLRDLLIPRVALLRLREVLHRVDVVLQRQPRRRSALQALDRRRVLRVLEEEIANFDRLVAVLDALHEARALQRRHRGVPVQLHGPFVRRLRVLPRLEQRVPFLSLSIRRLPPLHLPRVPLVDVRLHRLKRGVVRRVTHPRVVLVVARRPQVPRAVIGAFPRGRRRRRRVPVRGLVRGEPLARALAAFLLADHLVDLFAEGGLGEVSARSGTAAFGRRATDRRIARVLSFRHSARAIVDRRSTRGTTDTARARTFCLTSFFFSSGRFSYFRFSASSSFSFSFFAAVSSSAAFSAIRLSTYSALIFPLCKPSIRRLTSSTSSRNPSASAMFGGRFPFPYPGISPDAVMTAGDPAARSLSSLGARLTVRRSPPSHNAARIARRPNIWDPPRGLLASAVSRRFVPARHRVVVTRVVARASPAKVSSQNRKKRPVSR
eukprot:29427-Pelagococcus_subviridis.AAC.4